MMQSVTIVPVSGLGNRMRVVVSTVNFAEITETPIRIVWQPTWDCNARFDELFQPIPVKNITICKGTFSDTPATKHNLLLPFLLRKFKYQYEARSFKPATENALASLLEQYTSIYIDTCHALAPYKAEDVRRYFAPLPVIQKRIDGITSNFTEKTIGVHIRRTDNRMAIKHSPLSLFRKRIDRMLNEGKAEQIFLCTDDENVRSYLKELYGNLLITRSIELRRDTFQGIRDAVIDLWSLSKTSYILGSHYSSFSDTAAELGGASLEIIYQ